MKDEYIKRKDVEQMLEMAALISDGEYCGYCTEDIDINGIPAADVAPVVHGKNITKRHPVDEFVCSECGIILFGYERLEIDEDEDDESCYEYEFKFCPNCGAKMDEEEEKK